MYARIKLNGNSLKAHWFVFAFALILAGNGTVTYLDEWGSIKLMEFGLLFDFAILLPALYLICYRDQGKKAIYRAIGLACLGIWAAGKIVPEESHQILESVSFLRYVGLGVLFLIELRIVIAIFKSIFSSKTQYGKDRDAAIAEADMPVWVAKLMAWEANLWRKVWLSIQKIFSK
jgi:hypothetical protein